MCRNLRSWHIMSRNELAREQSWDRSMITWEHIVATVYWTVTMHYEMAPRIDISFNSNNPERYLKMKGWVKLVSSCNQQSKCRLRTLKREKQKVNQRQRDWESVSITLSISYVLIFRNWNGSHVNTSIHVHAAFSGLELSQALTMRPKLSKNKYKKTKVSGVNWSPNIDSQEWKEYHLSSQVSLWTSPSTEHSARQPGRCCWL